MDNIEEFIKSTIEDIGKSVVIRKKNAAKAKGGDWRKEVWGAREATRELLNDLAALAHNHNYKSGASIRKNVDHGEWLYDLVWHSGDIGRDFKEIILAAEIEWATWANSQEDKYFKIKYDFDKLLASKAKYRLMIFEGEHAFIADVFTKLIQAARGFSQSKTGEHYLLCGWNWDDQEFVFKHYIV